MTDTSKKTLPAFCAFEQKETDHSIDIDGAGEIVLTCTTPTGTEEAPTTCGRFLKFPKGTTPDELKALLASHKDMNEGQVSVASIEAAKDALIEAFTGGAEAGV